MPETSKERTEEVSGLSKVEYRSREEEREFAQENGRSLGDEASQVLACTAPKECDVPLGLQAGKFVMGSALTQTNGLSWGTFFPSTAKPAAGGPAHLLSLQPQAL